MIKSHRGRVAIAIGATVLSALLLGVGIGAATLPDPNSSDLSGDAGLVAVHPIAGNNGTPVPIGNQWNDGNPHFLPGTTISFRVSTRKSAFITVLSVGAIGVIICDGSPLSISDPQNAFGSVVLQNSTGIVIPFLPGSNFNTGAAFDSGTGNGVSPSLAAGTYTLGLSAECDSTNQDVDNPDATYITETGYLSFTKVNAK